METHYEPSDSETWRAISHLENRKIRKTVGEVLVRNKENV